MGSIAVMEKAMLIIMNDTGGDVRGDGGYSNAGEGGDGKYALILGIGFELFHWWWVTVIGLLIKISAGRFWFFSTRPKQEPMLVFSETELVTKQLNGDTDWHEKTFENCLDDYWNVISQCRISSFLSSVVSDVSCW